MTPQPCGRWQEAISALLDGEDSGVPSSLVEAHVAGCAGCRQYRADAERLRRLSRVRPAAPIPDLAPRIITAQRAGERTTTRNVVRLGLMVIAAQIVVLAVPELVRLAAGHEGRHVFAFSLTYAVALVLVAWRPARARTVFPIAVALAASLGITALYDAFRGDAAWLGEIVHLPEFLSVPLVWLLAQPHAPLPGPPTRAGFSVVEDTEPGADDAARTA